MKKQKLFTLLLALALTAGVLLLGCAPEDKNAIDWTMRAWVVSLDGQLAEEMDISVTGEIYTADGKTYLPLDIRTPDAFPYFYEKPDQGVPISISGETDGLTYYVWQGYSIDRQQSDARFGSYALCPEKGWLIMRWNEDSQRCLVASRDANADPGEILGYFQAFLELYGT